MGIMNIKDQSAFANPSHGDHPDYQGLTKREYFAAMALSGSCVEGGWEPKAVALFAIACADEILRQLGE